MNRCTLRHRLIIAFLLSLSISVTCDRAAWSQSQSASPQYVHEKSKRVPAQPMPASMYRLLEREGREATEKPEEMLDRLALKDGDVVADVGAGSGYFARRLAKRLAPNGQVLAVDIQQEMLDVLKTKLDELSLTNVDLILGDPNDPKLPEGQVDWVLLVDAYHEFGDPQAMLAKIRACLKPGSGRVALLEYRGEPALDKMKMIPADHKMTFEQVMIEWEDAGFQLDVLYGFLPLQHFFVFKAAPEPAQPSAEAPTAN